MRFDFKKEYFKWICDLICGNRFAKNISYNKLLSYLYDKEFIFLISRDANRAEDGIDLRHRFAYDYFDNDNYLNVRSLGPCSVLEMMVALAIRCEENIMDDPEIGDRTGQWFWSMISNLGLNSMTDDKFDLRYVNEVVERFLNREYSPDGRGGLFRIRNCDTDLRDVEIWFQLCWYLDSMA